MVSRQASDLKKIVNDSTIQCASTIVGDCGITNVGHTTNVGNTTDIGDATNVCHTPNVGQKSNVADKTNVGRTKNVNGKANVGDATNVGDTANDDHIPTVGHRSNFDDKTTVGETTNAGDTTYVGHTTNDSLDEQSNRKCSTGTDGAFVVPNVLDKQLKDVPLMANVDEVHIYHYALNLDVDFTEKCVTGCEILFLKPVNESIARKKFQMCLDCTLIDILSVEEIVLPDDFRIHFHGDECCCKSSTVEKNEENSQNETESDCVCCASCSFLQTYEKSDTKDLNYKTLPYAVYGWCIRVWNLETSKHHWPRCVGIRYKTKSIGPSLTWCKDQDGK